MHRFLTLPRLAAIFFGVFGVAIAGVLAFHFFWVTPGERCEANGNWYDIESRTCATPIYIPDITGRPEGVTRAEASAAKNEELVGLERQVAVERKARQEATEAERARVRALQER